MKKKKTLSDFIGILKTEGEYDFEANRKHAQDYVYINYVTSEIKSLISDYDFPVAILSDVNNRLENFVEVYDAQQQLEYLKNLITEGKVEKKIK